MEVDKLTGDISEQQKLVFSKQPDLNLLAPCKLNDGVIYHSNFEKKRFILNFVKSTDKVTLFIPASGSGSRMFQFLYQFLDKPNEENRSKTEKFLNAIQDFAFFELLPYELKNKVKNYDINLGEFVTYLLEDKGLSLGNIPKGLLPFHRSRSFVLNAFQEQLLQGLQLKEKPIDFHFTIKQEFERKIKSSLKNIQDLTGKNCKIECTTQNPETDSITFSTSKTPMIDDNKNILKRPSGHGALLGNLNSINSDIIFIKNIDNVQHESKAKQSIETLQYLGGLLQTIKNELKSLYHAPDRIHRLKELNILYQLFNKEEDFDSYTEEELNQLLIRPLRVCGMVRNEGQPGGGPFWLNSNGKISKQIIEKSQINMKGEQYKLMVHSQYFNPVLMAVSSKNILGKKLNLTEYTDPKQYFVVQKKYKGKSIKFLERPGLWNGGMADWISVFVEVPSNTFTPVKNVLDLLNNAHKDS